MYDLRYIALAKIMLNYSAYISYSKNYGVTEVKSNGNGSSLTHRKAG